VAFWSSWFAPKCESCGNKVVGAPPVVHAGQKLCPACHEAAVAAEEKKAAEREARRAAEEAARAKLEGNKQFGVDPRTR